MSIIKVELFEGKAYALDEWGNVWQLYTTDEPNLPQLRLMARINSYDVRRIMEPQLAKCVQ